MIKLARMGTDMPTTVLATVQRLAPEVAPSQAGVVPGPPDSGKRLDWRARTVAAQQRRQQLKTPSEYLTLIRHPTGAPPGPPRHAPATSRF